MENPTAGLRAADAVAARRWRCSPRPCADAHKYTITYELCLIRMVRTKNCARRVLTRAPPSSNSRATPAARSLDAAGEEVCHVGSADAPTNCTMSHHLQNGGQQEAVAVV